MTWEIFLGIVALIGFIVTITTPMIKLNTSIIRLNETISAISTIVSKNDEDNKESHKRIYARLDNHDNAIGAHNERITRLEGGSERKTEQIKDLEKETVSQQNSIVRLEEKVQTFEKDVLHTNSKIDQHINNHS